MTQEERFAGACRDAGSSGGIGTLGEKTLHAVLKQYYEPDPACQEVRVGRYVADICNDTGIMEIQTRSFRTLRKKLESFLDGFPVTVVYPVPAVKWLCWIDDETGQVTPKRKSPRRGTGYDIIPELYQIRNLLPQPALRFQIVLLELTEYRHLNGWSRDKKKGSSRCDRIPERIIEEICLDTPADYLRFLPDGLPQVFTSAQAAEKAGVRLSVMQTALLILFDLGAVSRVGKQGNSILYQRK